MMNKKFAKALNKATILVLGVAYKKDIHDLRESPALDVIKLIQDRGAKVFYNDPHVPNFEWEGNTFKSSKLTASLLKKADLTVILTNHTLYNYQWITDNAQAIFDTRNATKQVTKNRQKIELL
jgi:UDP-N-acetyl-D-glucosamine dehydrogenase